MKAVKIVGGIYLTLTKIEPLKRGSITIKMSHGISKSNPLSYDRKRKSNYIRGEEEKVDHRLYTIISDF